MDMLINFEAYNGRELQQFMSMLNQCEAGGLVDIRFVRQRLQNHLDSRFLAAKVKKARYHITDTDIRVKTCPSCGKQTLIPVSDLEGVKRVGCKCGYSQIIGNKHSELLGANNV